MTNTTSLGTAIVAVIAISLWGCVVFSRASGGQLDGAKPGNLAVGARPVQIFDATLSQRQPATLRLEREPGLSLACPISTDGLFLMTKHGLTQRQVSDLCYVSFWHKGDPSQQLFVRRVQ